MTSFSEPHLIALPMGKLSLRAFNAEEKAQQVLFLLRCGEDVVIDNLEVLDEILKQLTRLEEHALIIESGNLGKVLSVDLAKRLRFDRGLDIRPSLKTTNA
jgi:hypothetical protein